MVQQIFQCSVTQIQRWCELMASNQTQDPTVKHLYFRLLLVLFIWYIFILHFLQEQRASLAFLPLCPFKQDTNGRLRKSDCPKVTQEASCQRRGFVLRSPRTQSGSLMEV